MVYFPDRLKKKELTNPEKMDIKYELVLNGTTWAVADKI